MYQREGITASGIKTYRKGTIAEKQNNQNDGELLHSPSPNGNKGTGRKKEKMMEDPVRPNIF